MKEISSFLCVFSNYQRQQQQRPYFLRDSTLFLRSGPKLLSQFNQQIQFDRVYQTPEHMLQHTTNSLFQSPSPISTIVLLGAEQNHKLHFIHMLVARALQNSEVLFVDRAGKFTEYDVGEEEEDFKERLELVKIRSAELANIRYTLKKVGKGKEVVTIVIRGEGQERKLHIVEMRLQTEEKLMLVEGQLKEIFREGVIKQRVHQPLSVELNDSQKIFFCNFLSFEKQRTREDNLSIQLLTLLANKNELYTTKSQVRKPVVNDSQSFLAIKEQYERLEKTRMKISKRVQLLEKIYNQMTESLGEGVQTLSKHSIKLAHLNEYKATLSNQKLQLEHKIQKMTNQIDQIKAKLQQRSNQKSENTYVKMTEKLKNRLLARSQVKQTTTSCIRANVTHCADKDQDQPSKQSLKLQELERIHNIEIQQLNKEHKEKLKKMPQRKQLSILLQKARKYPSLLAYCDHIEQMISL